MSNPEHITVNGIKLIHTFRGHNLEVEAYSYQGGPRTYNLFKKKGDQAWRCDVVTSHSYEEISLDADAADLDAMLEAFTATLKAQHE